jgi:hypothetical protein
MLEGIAPSMLHIDSITNDIRLEELQDEKRTSENLKV